MAVPSKHARKRKGFKPEVLVPVGNIEAFFAAIQSGADAIYCGLKQFNARGRATNFTHKQFLAMVEMAHKSNVKVYATLNTVIKNKELPDLLDTLNFISKSGCDAVIIQDWGVYSLIKQYFPMLTVHASTQMGIHNSNGVNFAKKRGIPRVVLARELTLQEIKTIRNRTDAELEIFVHGALCYSFSGMCLFSSYLGSHGANRGVCTQPCRRDFKSSTTSAHFFNLKDNQQVNLVPELASIGIDSLKIEGRLKTADYVAKVTKSYRMALDTPEKMDDAEELLEEDLARNKTGYFMQNDLSESVTETTHTGLLLGEIDRVTSDGFHLETDYEINEGDRIRIAHPNDEAANAIIIEKLTKINQHRYIIHYNSENTYEGLEVYLARRKEASYPSRISEKGIQDIKIRIDKFKSDKMLKFRLFKPKEELILVRIDSFNWLKKITLTPHITIILNLSQKEWLNFNPNTAFFKNNRQKFIIELPKFIAEDRLDFYRDLALRCTHAGLKKFSISQLDQRNLLPKEATFITNENVYIFNDAALSNIEKEGAQMAILPFENDRENLIFYQNKGGIIPMFFLPELFFSRMPIKVKNDDSISDNKQAKFDKVVRDGITRIVPQLPTSLFQFYQKLKDMGYQRFLIDLSGFSAENVTLDELVKMMQSNTKPTGAYLFNYKRGLQ